MQNYGFVKCGLATLNGTISNPQENSKKIKRLIDTSEKQNVKILAFPELSLTGYTCQDLFHMSSLMDSVNTCLQDIVLFSENKDILFTIGLPVNVNDTLYNTAVIIQNGSILGVVPKQYIPNYNEFYEKRWFTPYIDFSITEIEILRENSAIWQYYFSIVTWI